VGLSDEVAELNRSFRRGFATTFAVDLLTKVIGAATVVILIRGLSVNDYAYVTLFLTLAQFAGSAAGGGVRTRYLREEAERVSRALGESAEEPFLRSIVRTAVILVGLGILAVPIVRAIGLAADHIGATAFVSFAIAFAAGVAASELAIARYQARRRFFAAGLVTAARAAALLAAALLIVLTGESIIAISLWLVTSMVVVGAATTVTPLLRAAVERTGSLRAIQFNHEELWLSLYYVAAAGFAYVDVMVAGALLDAQQVASLGASLRYLAIVQSPIPALGAVLRVRTAQVDVLDSVVNQRAMILGWLKRSTLPAAVFVGVVAVLAPFVIPYLDGGKYPDSVVALQIFLLTALSAYLTAPAVSILMAQRRYAFLALTYGAALLLNTVGDIAVAPAFGIVGIAIVSSTVYLAIDAILIVSALRHEPR
jgi:O-antigen/teichoic acid export membrane protein